MPMRWRGWTRSRVAVRMPGRRDAPAFAVDATAPRPAPPARRDLSARGGRRRKRRSRTASTGRRATRCATTAPSRCCRCRSGISRATASAANYAVSPEGLRGAAASTAASTTTVWHRLYAEASIPPRHRLRRLAGGHRRGASHRPPSDACVAPARLRARHRGARRRRERPHVPRAAWERRRRELPGHPGPRALAAGARTARALFGA